MNGWNLSCAELVFESTRRAGELIFKLKVHQERRAKLPVRCANLPSSIAIWYQGAGMPDLSLMSAAVGETNLAIFQTLIVDVF